jgi:hypothetical protein
MDALRFVICAEPGCRQVFFLCSRCDHGDRYCRPECRDRARRRVRHDAAVAYARSFKGRRAAARRQQRYRERLRKKVTHPGGEEVGPRATLSSPPAASSTTAPTTGGEEIRDGLDLDGDRARPAGNARDRDARGCYRAPSLMDSRASAIRLFDGEELSRPPPPPQRDGSGRAEASPRGVTGIPPGVHSGRLFKFIISYPFGHSLPPWR